MSSRLTTEDECIEFMARLSGREWAKFTTDVSWLRRKGELSPQHVPAKVKAITDQVMDADEWRRVRLLVSKLRRALYRQRVKEERTAKIERRRDYMRTYMVKYRRQL